MHQLTLTAWRMLVPATGSCNRWRRSSNVSSPGSSRSYPQLLLRRRSLAHAGLPRTSGGNALPSWTLALPSRALLKLLAQRLLPLPAGRAPDGEWVFGGCAGYFVVSGHALPGIVSSCFRMQDGPQQRPPDALQKTTS